MSELNFNESYSDRVAYVADCILSGSESAMNYINYLWDREPDLIRDAEEYLYLYDRDEEQLYLYDSEEVDHAVSA